MIWLEVVAKEILSCPQYKITLSFKYIQDLSLLLHRTYRRVI
jgi:hypothetical protein